VRTDTPEHIMCLSKVIPLIEAGVSIR